MKMAELLPLKEVYAFTSISALIILGSVCSIFVLPVTSRMQDICYFSGVMRVVGVDFH